ncbi:GIY-YIG nuclease superfamily protein [compost metagenome]
MFYTYILHSRTRDKFYIGASENPEERLKKHNNKNKGFTNQAQDWKIVFRQSFPTKKEALDYELQIKKWKSRKKIVQLISDSVDSERPDA